MALSPTDLNAREAQVMIREGALSPVALVEACLARIRALELALQAWVHVDEAGALATAKEREADALAGRHSSALAFS